MFDFNQSQYEVDKAYRHDIIRHAEDHRKSHQITPNRPQMTEELAHKLCQEVRSTYSETRFSPRIWICQGCLTLDKINIPRRLSPTVSYRCCGAVKRRFANASEAG
jgi:hypothetical protein